MSAGIRARRVVDPLPVQRGPYPQHAHHDQSITGIANAWDNIAEAKKVLQNAEARLEDAEFHRAPSLTPMSQDVRASPPRRYLSDYSHDGLPDYSHQGPRVPVDVVPSLKIGSSNKTSRHERDKPRKKVTIVDVPTPRDKYQHHQSIHSPHRQSSLASTAMNNYQPRPHLHQSPPKQYNDPQLQRIENRMMMDNRAPRSGWDGSSAAARSPLYEDPLLRTQLREQERRAALLRTLSRPTDYQRPSSFSSPPHHEQPQVAHNLSPSSHDILDNGPTNLSIDNSTEIRVLNDIPLPQTHENHRVSSKHRQSTKHRTPNNYVSAYERLYGNQPGDKLYESQHSSQESIGGLSHKRTNGSEHFERLREKIEQQKSSVGASDPAARIWHRDNDPVVVSNGEQRPVVFESSSPVKAPVRKVASAPAAPAYKGFNEVETRFRMPDGSIVGEDQAGRKTTRKRSSKSARDKLHNDLNRDRALQPNRSQPQQRVDAKISRSHAKGSSKPVRKVQKITEAKKPKKPERTGIISTTSWREGQKAVLKVLGPAPKPQKPMPHSPPTRDTETSESVDPPIVRDQEPKSDEEELSQHTMDSEKYGGEDIVRSDSPVPNVDKLPSEAKDVLEDLHLEDSDDESEKDFAQDDTKKEKKQTRTTKASRKKKVARSRKEPETILPSKRVRHYNADDVQKYIAKQKADRKKRLQDEKRQRMQAEERKKEQLEELFKKQKESVKISQKPMKDDRQRIDETFSKEPVTAPPDPHASRQRPVHTNFKRLDVTGSDKENKGVWSTSSSSDSSLRSSPQTEGSNEIPLHLPVGAAEPNHDQGGPIEVVVTRMTTDAGRPNGEHRERNVPDTIVEEDGVEMMDTTPAERRQAPPTVQDAWTQPQSLPTGSSKSKPRSKAERLQALKATASALQGKIESEVRKLTSEPRSPDRPVDLHVDDRWAYPPPIDVTMMGNTAPPVDKGNKRVRFPGNEDLDDLPSTRYERLVGNDRDYHVFTGSLPGVGNLSDQASRGRDDNQQADAATKIQAAYRGHSVRQRLDWRLPSGATLKDKIQGNVPQIHVSAVSEALDSPRTSPYSSGGEAGDSEGESLSEGPISEEASHSENLDYIPKFKHMTSQRQRPQGSTASSRGLNNARNNNGSIPGGIGARGTASWDRSLNDGLSVINIYAKKYQEANKGSRVYHGKLPHTAASPNARSKSPASYLYDNDFNQKDSTTSQYQSSSPSQGSSPVRELLAGDRRSSGAATESISYGDDFTGSGSPSVKSDAKASHRTAPSSASSSQHLSKPSSRHGRRSPLGGASDVGHVKSDADKTLNSYKSDEFESSSSDEEPTPRKRPIRTPSPRLRKARTSSKSPLSTSLRSSPSSKSSSQSPTSDVRKSPPRERLSPSLNNSRRSPHSRSKSPRSQESKSSRSPPMPKSPVTKEVLSHFRPIPSSSDDGGLREQRQGDMGVERPLPRAATAQTLPTIANIGHNVPQAYYSPGALELKMAAELNLLESLEVSVRQLTDMERTRAISLAQQESVSLARILQSRQRDHERELQLLSLKARQEVEDANKQLQEVQQRAASTANEAERALVQVRKEASDSNNETARRLMESQAEAARVTAEAARQLAEARTAASQPAPVPMFDTNKVATETATAAASAAVTAAMEQQRQHQLDLWQEMRNAALPPQPIGTSTRNFGVGDFPISSSHPISSRGSYSSSFTSPSKTPSGVPSYTDDFTDSATQSRSRSPKSATSSSVSSKSVATAVDESQDSVPQKRPPSPDSIKTPSDLSVSSARSAKSNVSVPTQSGVSVERDVLAKSDHSSIQTESGADPLTSTGSASVAEDIPDESIKSADYSISFDGTESDVSKLSDVSSEQSSVVSSVITRSKSKDADKKPGELPAERSTTGLVDDSFSKLSAEMLRQQLRDEEVRAQQQAALFRLREKALTEKTRAQLKMLEHEKRRLKEKDDEESLQAIKKQQKLLLTKLQQEQVEIRRLKTAQRAASRERQLLLFQQQEVSRMRKEAQEVKGRMKDLSNVSLSSSVECLASEDEVSMDSFDGASNLPEVLSESNASSAAQRLYEMECEVKDSRPQSAAEKQAQVMQKLKKLQQPLNLKHLTKREQKLMRRRKNVEELLAWKQRLDEEEKRITNMEEEALHAVEGPKDTKKESRPKSEAESSPRTPSSEHLSDAGRTVSSVSEAKSASEKRSRLSDVEGQNSIRDSESSIAEDVSQASSIAEEIPSIKTPQKSSTSHTITEASSDDTLKNESPKDEYASESFETADRTLTPTKSSTPISVKTPRSANDSSPSLLSQRKRHESESGSESERSFSQTMSETASDQSDIEGRVRALKDALRKRKMEAERLRKQQKRMNREKLKAQEASLKKQLEAYDQLIEKTKAELKAESNQTTQSASTVKPKIKQPRVSESQRLRDQSHTKSLRQRAVSESNREGIPDVALRKQRSGSEGSISSRSSFDEDMGQAREVHTPASTVSTPPTTPRHTEDGISPVHKAPSPLQRDRSISSSSSARLPSESPDRETSHKTPSPLRSQQSADEEKSRSQSAASSDIPEEVESQSSISVTPDVSMKEVVAEKPFGKGDVDNKPAGEKPAMAAQVSVDEPTAKSEASDVPEDIVSLGSSYASDQEKLPAGLSQDKKETAEDAQTKSSLSERSAPVSEMGEDLSYSYSGSGKSLSRHSRQRSDKSDVSYSDDFFESSVSLDVQNQDAKSETDDDISEHLSMVSEPSDKSSGQSQELLGLKAKTPEKEDVAEGAQEQVPSVTVSVAKDLEQEEEKKEDEQKEVTEFPPEPSEEPVPDALTELNVGDRVLVGGVKPGVLRFKGPTHFASGFWGGVELDEPHGSNNGTYGDRTYFACKPKHGIFAPPEKLSPFPLEDKTGQESEDESSVVEEISVPEDINSEASVHTASKSESVKDTTPQQTPRSVGYSEDFESEDVQEEKGILEEEEMLKPDTSESSISRVTSRKSHSVADKNAEDTDEDSIAEEISDEAALEKLIHSAALAVESFSKDDEQKPEEEGTEAETPRGPPETEVAVTSKDQLVDSITDHLTNLVVKDSVQVVSELASHHVQQRDSEEGADEEVEDNEANELKQERDKSSGEEKSSGSLLEMLAGDEALPEEVSPREEEDEEIKEEIPEEPRKEKKVTEKVDNLTSSLLTEAISDMLALKRQRAEKISAANQRLKDVEDDYVELTIGDKPERTSKSEIPGPKGDGMVTPPNQELPDIRAVTPFTPDDSPTHRPTSTSPLSDELFKSRVQIESSPEEQGQVARPGSPVLGESSLLNPEALSERLEHLQTLDQDMGDLFGDQEWFDDDFGSMPKSKSIIQVPVRNAKEGKEDANKSQDSGATSPAEARRFDLMKFAEEPFYAVPHNRNDVKSLVEKSVTVYYDRVQLGGEFTSISPPSSVMGDDTKSLDIESTSKKAYKKLVFDLAGEIYEDIVTEQKPTVQSPWMKPKRQPRRYFFDQPPKSREEVGGAIQDRVLNVTSLDQKPKPESAMSKFGKKKKDHVDEILTQELREEEPEWVDYDEDELSVKMQLSDAIFDSLLVDTAMVLSRIQDKRKARSRPMYDDDDLEF